MTLFESMFVTTVFQLYTIHALNCITVKGPNSGPNIGAPSSATCPSNYDIISCGINIDSDDDPITTNTHGQFIYTNNNTCVSYNAYEMEGITIHARCCDIQSLSISCTPYISSPSVASDNEISSVSCSNHTNEILVACNFHEYPGYKIDGGWPGNNEQDDIPSDGNATFPTLNQCTSRAGWSASSGVITTAMCCGSTDDNVDIDCVSIWGIKQTTQYGWSNVSCPSTYPTMTSCQPTSWTQNWKRSYIEDDSSCNIQMNDNTISISAVAIWYEHASGSFIFLPCFYNLHTTL